MSTETESPDLKRLKSGRDWNGYLTLENCEAVADRVRRLLEGHRYAWVRCFEEQRGSFPEVRQGLRMRDQGVTTHRSTLEDGGDFAGFNVSDTYGVWGAHTSVADQAGVRSLGYGHRSLTYLHFKQHGHYDGGRVEIEMCAPAGHRLYWVIAVEPQPDSEDA